jgi:hypothetical protein
MTSGRRKLIFCGTGGALGAGVVIQSNGSKRGQGVENKAEGFCAQLGSRLARHVSVAVADVALERQTVPHPPLKARCCRLADIAPEARFKRVFAPLTGEIIPENFCGIIKVVWYIRALSFRRN